ncbi:uncharacterized protein EI90DRAFT_3033781 [Cantharellus anzutake]|uniref:uncharacterized protein n=1 Tax=Cantharellus anzutake TaxID=1750568 RepID=UPI0019069E29|nr:uncharacterized protein EI90DRAFT_3033781 [Cantharellus anzutake]KAF8341383.1 hypothetical protein EI90DRAFT_3033781 [Cantharellus anzutake]
MLLLIIVAGLFVAVRRLLQRGSLSRLLIFGGLTIAGVHFATNLLPHTNYADGMTLVVVGLICTCALAAVVHHDIRTDGGLTRDHEEFVLISLTALVWLTLTMAWRISHYPDAPDLTIPNSVVSRAPSPAPSRQVHRPIIYDSGCIPGRPCVVEEWYW